MRFWTVRVATVLAAWLTIASCAAAPRPEFLADPGFLLFGYWSKESALEGTSFLLSRPGSNGYSVRFSSAGCLGSETKQILATFKAGYLELSEEVTEYSESRYHRLALYRLGTRNVLVPEPDETAFRAGDQSLAFEYRSGVP